MHTAKPLGPKRDSKHQLTSPLCWIVGHSGLCGTARWMYQSLVSHRIDQRHIEIIRQWRISVSSYWRLQPANSTFGPRVRVLLFREVGNPWKPKESQQPRRWARTCVRRNLSRGPLWPSARGEVATSELGRFGCLPRTSWQAVGSRI
jgi:hypothetical protein